jgi:hypothetical protein
VTPIPNKNKSNGQQIAVSQYRGLLPDENTNELFGFRAPAIPGARCVSRFSNTNKKE